MKIKFKSVALCCLVLIPLTCGLFFIAYAYYRYSTSPLAVMQQIRRIDYAVAEFYKRYHHFPGDLPNAGKILNCTECESPAKWAGDGIIGDPALINSILPHTTQINAAAPCPTDENRLFWAQLYYAGLIATTDLSWFEPSPPASLKAKAGGRYIVGFTDGIKPLTPTAEHGFYSKGPFLILVDEERYPLSPLAAFDLDCGSKKDNCCPSSGNIQTYGTAECIVPKAKEDYHCKYDWNIKLNKKVCGLIYALPATLNTTTSKGSE